MGRIGAAGVVLALLSACSASGPQNGAQRAAPVPTVAAAPADDDARFHAEIATLRRINRVAWPILQANADACTKLGLAGLTVGIAAINLTNFPPARQPLAERILAIGFEPRVLVVPEGTPAYQAGMREDDVVKAVNDFAIVVRADAPQQVLDRLALTIKSGDRVRLLVARGAQELTFEMAPVTTCRFVVNADDNPEIRATVSDDRTIISEGLSRFAARDDELALLLAHEIAHLMVKRSGPETFADGTPARFNRAMSADAEHEADEISLRLAATAGYPIGGAVAIWERLRQAAPSPSRLSFAGTHPITETRLAALRATVADLANAPGVKPAVAPGVKPATAPEVAPSAVLGPAPVTPLVAGR